MKGRLEKFLDLLRDKGCGAALISRPENVRYLTGFSGEGWTFVCDEGATILTDFRYQEQAARQSPACQCVVRTVERPVEKIFSEMVRERELRQVAFEDEVVTVKELTTWQGAMPEVELLPLGGLVEELRKVKDDEEISCIVRASEIACRALQQILPLIRPGASEREIQLALDYEMLRSGSEALAFDTVACAGPNGSLPHAVPSDYRLSSGDFITLDFGAQVNGYKTDMTRTFAVGEPDPVMRDVYHTVLEAQMTALALVEPGVCCRDVDRAARDIIDRRYPGAFGHSLGHSVGLFIHESPNFSTKCEEILKPGYVMTVEPGIYLPGKGGCRIEDTVVVTDGGCINLITAPKELTIL